MPFSAQICTAGGVKWLAFLLLSGAFVVLDMLSPFSRPGGAMLLVWGPSLALGAACVHASRHRWARVPLAITLGVLWMVQAAAIRTYNAPIDAQIAAAAKFSWHDVRPVIVRALPAIVGVGAVFSATWYGAASYAAQKLPRWVLVAACLVALLGLPRAHRGTPEFRALTAVPQMFAKPMPPTSLAPTPLPATPHLGGARILLVLGESVRASDYCEPGLAPSAPCEVAPRVHALLPERIALHEMRSLASYTAISTATVLTGRAQQGTRDVLVQMPTVFDVFASLRGEEHPVKSAYLTSQLASVFDRKPVAHVSMTLETLLGRPVRDDEEVLDMNADRLLADAFVRAFSPSWTFSMVHLSGTHAPYYIDPARAYFKPYRRDVGWSSLDDLHRAYKSAIRIQDEELARMIETFIKPEGPWVVLFTSDHGEAFGEHAAVHHGQNLYDEQTHVPAFVAFGGGALNDAQVATLRARALKPATHLDVLPTVLDMLGVLDAPSLQPFVQTLEGESLLRARTKTPRTVPLTNCTPSFPCPLSTWGVLGETHTLIAQPWDRDFLCLRIHGDIETGAECTRLRAASRQWFPLLPNGDVNNAE